MNYVLDANNNRVEAYSKEEVLAVLNKAITDGTLANVVADAAFITKVKCCVGGGTHSFAFVTQAKYNELKAKAELLDNCYYFITDDTTADEFSRQLTQLTTAVENLRSGTAPKTQRIFEANPFVYTSGVKSFDVSNYLNNRGYFKVVVLDSQAEPDYSGATTYTYYMTVDLIALENSKRKTDATSSVSTYLEIKNGLLQLTSDNVAKEDYIMAIDYYTVG